MDSKYYGQIDFLKGLAILGVLLLHSLSYSILYGIYAVFHIWQAVPIFMILLGLNMAISFNNKENSTLKAIYNKKYFNNRFSRIFFPFLLLFLIFLIVGPIFHFPVYLGVYNLIGVLPISGPGNFFIGILFQFVFIFPFLYYLYKINPKIMLLLSFIFNLSFELLAPHIELFQVTKILYHYNILRYLFAIALGIYFSKEISKLNDLFKKNIFFFIGFAVSLGYLLAFAVFSFNFNFLFPDWGTQNIFSFFYPLFLVFLGLRLLPKSSDNIFSKFFMFLGKISYHIFLVQIFFFGRIYELLFSIDDSFFLTVPLCIIICIVLGAIFKEIESFVKKVIRKITVFIVMNVQKKGRWKDNLENTVRT